MVFHIWCLRILFPEGQLWEIYQSSPPNTPWSQLLVNVEGCQINPCIYCTMVNILDSVKLTEIRNGLSGAFSAWWRSDKIFKHASSDSILDLQSSSLRLSVSTSWREKGCFCDFTTIEVDGSCYFFPLDIKINLKDEKMKVKVNNWFKMVGMKVKVIKWFKKRDDNIKMRVKINEWVKMDDDSMEMNVWKWIGLNEN